MGRILAMDYGTKRVGIAVTDPLRIIASALTTIPTSEIIIFLTDYMKKEEVDEIVIGFPKNLDNTPTHSTALVLEFKEKIDKLFPEKKIHLWDERYTSKMALQTMIDAGTTKKSRKNKSTIDKISATILLQSFLEKK